MLVRTALFASLIVVSAVFGGCFGSDDNKDAAATTSPAANAGGNNTTVVNNTAPIASFTISDNGTVLEEVNGTITAPLGVNLTFDASNSTDAEGGNLTYAWDFDGNATAANVTTLYAFTEAGNHTITLTVDDGNLTGTANLTIVVGGGPAPGTFLREDKQAFGTLAAQNALYNNACASAVSKDWVLVDVEENGTASVAIKVTVTLAAMGGQGAGGFTKLAFKDPAGAILKENNSGGAAKTLTIDGPLAAGTYKVEASMCSATATITTGSPALSGIATYVSV